MSQILGVNDPYVIPGTMGGGGGASLPEDSAGYLYNDGSGNLSYDSALTNLGSPLTLSRTANDANGFQINMVQRRGSGVAGQDNDVLGTISFKGYNDAETPELVNFGSIIGQIASKTDGTEYGRITIAPSWRGYINNPSTDNALHIGYDSTWGTPGTVTCSLGNFASPVSVGSAYFCVAAIDGAGLCIRSSMDIFKIWSPNIGSTELEFTQYLGTNWHPLLTMHYGNFSFFGATSSNLDPTDRGTIRIGKNITAAPVAASADMVKMWVADYAAGDARLNLIGEKNTNTLTLGAGNVHFSPTTMGDDSVSGETFTGTAGENLVWGDVVYLKSDGKFWKADFNATTTTPAVAFCTGTINADASGEFLRRGWIRDDSAYDFTFGAQAGTIYLGESGAITQTAPSGSGDQVQVLGWALEADIWYFDPQFVIVEV